VDNAAARCDNRFECALWVARFAILAKPEAFITTDVASVFSEMGFVECARWSQPGRLWDWPQGRCYAILLCHYLRIEAQEQYKELIGKIQAAGGRIDGIGIQGHL